MLFILAWWLWWRRLRVGGGGFLKGGPERNFETVAEDDLQQSSLLESHTGSKAQDDSDIMTIEEIVEEDIIPMIAVNDYSEVESEYLEIDENGGPVHEEEYNVAMVETCQAIIEDEEECFAAEEDVDGEENIVGNDFGVFIEASTDHSHKTSSLVDLKGSSGKMNVEVLKGDSGGKMNTEVVKKTQLRYKKEIAAGRIHSIVVKGGDSKDGLQTTITPKKTTTRIRIKSKSK